MRITIDGRAIDRLSPGQERFVSIGEESAKVTGSVMETRDATAAAFRVMRIAFSCIAALGLLVFIGLAAIAVLHENLLLQRFALVMIVLVPILCLWSYRGKEAKWIKCLPQRMAGLPPLGTPVELDARGLTLGDRLIPWPDLSVTLLELLDVSDRHQWAYVVSRLELRTSGAEIALDRNLMHNGAAIVGEAYRRLLRAQPRAGWDSSPSDRLAAVGPDQRPVAAHRSAGGQRPRGRPLQAAARLGMGAAGVE